MSVSRHDVIMAYRFFLGREPESDAAIAEHMKCDDLPTLRDHFLQSAEFAKRARLPVGRCVLPLDLPAMEVDTDADNEQMRALVAQIQAAWAHLGRIRPHFSVLTDPKFLPANLEGSIDSFWESGETEAAGVQRILEREGLAALHERVCVEYGCGVGRVSMGLARRFRAVHGYDISPGHLAHAEHRAHALGIGNLTLHLCSENVVEDLQKCDVFYSRIVFQHNPPPVITRLIGKALRALKPGGIAVFQVPTYGIGYRYRTAEWLVTEHALDMQMHCLPQRRIFEVIEREGCIPLEVRVDNSTGDPERWISNTFIVRKPDGRLFRRLLQRARAGK